MVAVAGKGEIQMQIKIKYHTDIEKIEKIAAGDWIDLRAAETVFVPKESTN